MKRAFEIVIVDDQPIMFRALSTLLEHSGDLRLTHQSRSAQDFLHWFEDGHADLVIMEMFVGDSDALQLVRTIRAKRPHQRILIFSGLDANEYAQRALAAGAHGYIMKTQPVTDVPNAIRAVLNGRLYVPDAVGLALTHPSVLPEADQHLTGREFAIFDLLGRGFSTREIAESLEISPKTVEKHRENIKFKLRIRNTARLISEAGRWVDRAGANTFVSRNVNPVVQSKSAVASHD